MHAWKEFGAGEAETITGMDRETQRVKRRRGQLPAIQGGKARLNGVLLGEMILIHEISPYHIVNNLTARSIAAAWIAYWALCEGGMDADTAAQMTSRRQTPPPSHMIAHHTDKHLRDTIFTDDPSAALANDQNAVGVIVDLRALGKRLAERAGSLLEDGTA